MSDRRALYPYFLLVSLTTTSLAAVFTMLGEFRDELGFSETGLGVMVAMGFFAAFAGQVGLARFADRGHSIAMIRLGLLALIASLLVMAVATELWQFVAARMLLGLGLGMIFPSVRRIVIAHDRAAVGTNLGLLGSFDVAGFVVGPLLAGGLVELVGFRAPFVVFAVLTALFVPSVAHLPADVGAIAEPSPVLRNLLARRGIRASLLAAGGWFAMIGVFETVWAVLLTDLGAGTWVIGVTLSIIVAPMVFFAPIGGRLAQRHGPLRVLSIGVLAVVPCVVLYGFVDSLVVLTLIAAVQGIGDAVTFPATQVAAAMSADDDQLASAQGLMGAALQLGAGVVALPAGAAYEAWGPGPVFMTTGVFMALGVVAAAVVAAPLRRDGHPSVFGDPSAPRRPAPIAPPIV